MLEEEARTSKVPITLLTGFLGAGKTSRLNATLLTGSRKIAVIENELGALGVDGALVANHHDDGVIELSNGCLCCSAEVDLIAALEALAHRRSVRPYDHVVIETTGLADVAPVVALLRDQDDPLAEDYYFSGVVTIVNAANFKPWISRRVLESEDPTASLDVPRATGFGLPGTLAGTAAMLHAMPEPSASGREAAVTAFWRQVALADRIVVSKVDLLRDGEDEIHKVSAALAAANPLADVLVDRAASVCPLPLDADAQGASEVIGAMALSMVSSATKASPFVKLCKRQRPNAPSDHLAGVDVLTLPVAAAEPLEEESLRAFVRELLEGDGRRGAEDDLGEAWRVKGLIPVAGIGPAVLQGVGDQVEIEPWAEPIKQSSTFLVVIGEGLDSEAIQQRLAQCVSDVRMAAVDAPEA